MSGDRPIRNKKLDLPQAPCVFHFFSLCSFFLSPLCHILLFPPTLSSFFPPPLSSPPFLLFCLFALAILLPPIMSSGPNYAFSTPQNTPANNAPINSRAQQPGLSSLKEGEIWDFVQKANQAYLELRVPEGDLDKVAATSVLAHDPKFMNMMQAKLSGLVGQTSGYIESLPANVRRRVAGLKGVQKDHAKLEAQFQEKVLELEKEFFAKFTPLYQKRAAIVNGNVEPTEDEVTAGEKSDNEKDEDKGPKIKTEPEEDEDNTPMNGVPEFWLSAMKNDPSLAEIIIEYDEAALKSLVDIRMEYLEKPGFRLIFEFAENEYFSNKTLTKTYYYQEETGYAGDFIYDHAVGDKVEWKGDKNLTVKVETKKQRNKSTYHPNYERPSPFTDHRKSDTRQTRTIKKSVPTDSFFNFFAPPQPPTEEDGDEAAVDIEERLELDYTLGEEIKEKLIPRAIDWFTGEALRFEHLGDDELDGEFEDEDDEDEDDLSDDHDEDDSEEEVPATRFTSFFSQCRY